MTDTLFMAADALTDTDIGLVPLSEWSWGPALNAGLSITGTINPKMVPRSLVEPGQVILYLYRGGRLWGGSIVSLLEPKGQSVVVTASGFESYPNRVYLVDRLDPKVYADPLDISRELWTWLQGQPDADLGIVMDAATTNGKVKVGTPAEPFALDWWDGRSIGSYLSDLASADDGFDYRIDVTADHVTGVRTKKLVHGYPRLGRRREEVRFDTRTNVTVLPDERIGWLATDVQVLGAGEGRNMPMSVRGKRRTGYLRNMTSVSMKAVKAQDHLNARANAEMAARAYPRVISSLVIRNHLSALLGAFNPGDDVYASLHSGWTDYDGWVRVMGYSVSTQNGQEQITVDVAHADQFVYGPDPNIDLSSVGGDA